ncbi:hypothetical protein GQ457_13G014330 [Hibiscus cannabinus]
MSCFMLPECILELITNTMRRYLWSGRANARGWAHVAWNKGGDKQIIFSAVHDDNSPNQVRCKEFMRSDGKSWDVDKVKQVFSETDANAILGCPICPIQGDLQVWGHHPTGVHNVKFGYRWIVSNRGMEGDHSSIWKTIVSMATLPKIKVFAWRLCFEALPLGRKLAAVGINPGICKMCQGPVETGLHAFRECPSIKEAFDLSNLSICLPAGEFTDCKAWLESVQLNMNQEQFTFFMTLLWNLWNRRNKWIHDGQLIPQRIVVDYAQLLSADLLNAQETSRASNPSASQERWARPLQDRIKINVDGAFNPTSRKVAVGVIARNSHGMMVDG